MEKVIEKYSDMLFRLCLVMLGNYSDAEDAVQETFIKYIRKSPEYELTVYSFIGSKKADAPLPINGTWKCEFTIK